LRLRSENGKRHVRTCHVQVFGEEMSGWERGATHYWLQSFLSALFVSAPDGFLNLRYEYFTVSDFACLRGLEDCVHSLLNESLGQNHCQLDFGKEVDGVFAAAVDLGMALLAAVPADFRDGHAFDADFAQGILYLFKPHVLNDCT